jgi:uncharacterized protein YacL
MISIPSIGKGDAGRQCHRRVQTLSDKVASRTFGPTDRSVVMPINWAELPFQAIGLLAGLVFVASLIGNSLTRNAFVGAILTVIIFVAVYVAWDYYPHGYMQDVRFPNAYSPGR